MTGWRVWLTGALLGLPPVILAASGFVHLQDGIAVNAAFPVPLNISGNKTLPRAAYADAAENLRHVNERDGNARISLAEAGLRAGENQSQILSQLQGGLAHAPASAEGWTVYAEILASSNSQKAAQVLDQAYTLAPYDFFWAGRQARLAAHIWNDLNEGTRDQALRQTRMLWDDPMLRDELVSLGATSEGAQLLNRAFADDADARRSVYRWISARRRQLQPAKS